MLVKNVVSNVGIFRSLLPNTVFHPLALGVIKGQLLINKDRGTIRRGGRGVNWTGGEKREGCVWSGDIN